MTGTALERLSRSLKLAVALSLFAVAGGFGPAGAQQAEVPPGPAADVIRFRAFDVDRAPRDLEADRMDLYIYSLKTAAAERLVGDSRYTLYQAPASTVSLILNPAPAPRGELNPFAIKEVRQAVQYLVDREYIAREIYRGMARPMVTHVSPEDFDFLTVYDIDRGAGITYAPEHAREMIRKAMTDAGAVLTNGVWHYNGRPVRIKLVGRVEDERRDIADLIRVELEGAGFQVAVSYLPFAAAVLTVYSSDPKVFDWHIYTEGWGRGAPQRYDYSNINQMYAPWLGNMPGWREVGFWQYDHPELDELGKKLFRGEFSGLEERNEMYRRMTEIGLDESVRIWVVTAENTFPAKRGLEGVTVDLVSGPKSPWSLREMHLPGSNVVTVGNLWVWTERTTWNPVGGFGDVYSTDIWRGVHDSPMWNHPFTGAPIPVRATFEVETAGPGGKLSVPADAVMWNAVQDRWTPVGSGVTATSKVVFDYSGYFESKWHHGRPIEMADVVYSIAQGWELAYDPDKARIEVAIGVTARPYLETFKGFRFIDDRRVEVYVDFWHFEEAYIASYASPSSLSMPWELLFAMDDLVFNQRRAAYSDTAASRYNVSWLSLVMERDASLVNRTLNQFRLRRTMPERVFQIGGRSLVTWQDAEARYQAALSWFDTYGHLVISNGPYYLADFDPPAQFAELRAFRDETYPFRAGDWLFGDPPALSIENVRAEVVVGGEPAVVAAEVAGPGELGLSYLLLDPAIGEVVAKGEAERLAAEPGSGAGAAGGSGRATFAVRLPADLTATLFPGLYELYLVAHSDQLAQVVDRQVDLEVE